MHTALKSLVIAGLLVNAAVSAQAQNTTPPMSPASMAGASSSHMHKESMGHGRGMHGRHDRAKTEAKVAQGLAELKTKLQIAASQESAWTAYSTTMKPAARQERSRLDPVAMEKLTTPERIDKMRSQRAERRAEIQAQIEKREDATKIFYAALNADQKKVFDTAHSSMMQRWGSRMGKGHGQRHGMPDSPAKS